MQCPKCKSSMEHKFNPFADYEQCSYCKGLWLDATEEKRLKLAADVIDSGDAEVGKEYNDMHFVYCPQCPGSKFDAPNDPEGTVPARGIQMLRMVDPQQPHIWFEQCPVCFGRFYDAGEFKDFSENSISDFFKKFAAKERK